MISFELFILCQNSIDINDSSFCFSLNLSLKISKKSSGKDFFVILKSSIFISAHFKNSITIFLFSSDFNKSNNQIVTHGHILLSKIIFIFLKK